MTQILLSSTEDKVLECIHRNGLTFPIAKGGNEAMSFYGLSFWPSAVIMADGKMVWRGNPQSLNDRIYEGLLGTHTGAGEGLASRD